MLRSAGALSLWSPTIHLGAELRRGNRSFGPYESSLVSKESLFEFNVGKLLEDSFPADPVITRKGDFWASLPAHRTSSPPVPQSIFSRPLYSPHRLGRWKENLGRPSYGPAGTPAHQKTAKGKRPNDSSPGGRVHRP
jgi:hypothetical protein